MTTTVRCLSSKPISQLTEAHPVWSSPALGPSRASAYAALDRIGEKLQQDDAPEGTLEIYVVDEGRQPVPRPGAQ